MSHFCGLVILTPKYLENHTFEDSLAKYDENLDVPEYSRGEVSDFEKVGFIEYYKRQEGEKLADIKKILYNKLLREKKFEAWTGKEEDKERYLYKVANENKEVYVEIFKELYQDLFDEFSNLYEKHGEDWNSNCWRVNPVSGKWEEYSTYNPESKWDWYDENGRWSCAIKTKDNQFVNECFFGEIDWTNFKPEDYEEKEKETIWGEKYRPLKVGVKWHFTEKNLPYCFVIDGEWIEKGQMLYWGLSANEMSEEDWNKKMMEVLKTLPQNSEVYNIDFHI